MADINRVIIEGRLTKEIDTRETASGKVIARFTIANNYGWGENKGTNFVNCVAFGKTAEVIERFISKGDRATYEGEWRTGSYEKDGKKVYTNDFMVNNVSFQSKPTNITLNVREEDTPADPIPNGFEEIENDLPF